MSKLPQGLPALCYRRKLFSLYLQLRWLAAQQAIRTQQTTNFVIPMPLFPHIIPIRIIEKLKSEAGAQTAVLMQTLLTKKKGRKTLSEQVLHGLKNQRQSSSRYNGRTKGSSVQPTPTLVLPIVTKLKTQNIKKGYIAY